MKRRKIIASGIHFLFAKAFNQRVPFQVHIRLLEQCNRSCAYCKGDYVIKNQKPADVKLFLKLVDEFVKLGTKRFTLFGGEPLLYQGIETIARRIKDYGLSCSVITNGSLLKQHKELLNILDLITISLDGDRECHDAYRGQGSYDQAIEAIKLARDKGVPVQLLCTLTHLTDPKLSHLTEVAQKYGCLINFEQLRPIFNPDGTVTLRPEDSGKEKINKLIDYQLAHNNPKVVISDQALRRVRNWPAPYQEFRLLRNQNFNVKTTKCYCGKFSVVVEPDGSLIRCCVFRPNYQLVNAFEEGAQAAWHSISKSNCVGCCSFGYNTLNLLFSLNLNTCLHLIRRKVLSSFVRN